MLQKSPIKIWDVNFDKMVIWKLVKTKSNSKYLIGIKFDKAIRSSALIVPKMSGYVKTFKVKGDKDKHNKLMSFCIENEKLLEKNKALWTKTEDSKNIELNAVPVNYDRYIKTKIRTCHKVYTNFRGLNVLEDDVKFESCTVNSIDLCTTQNIICQCI